MRWIWIDRFEEFVPGVRATAIKNVSLAEEHLHDHWEAFPIHPASLMIEGMAQTGGILVGQARNFEEKVLLGKVVKAEFEDIVCPGDQITYQAVVDTVNQDASFIQGVVLRNGQEIGRVELMFTHVDHNMGGLEFPEENFVFTGQFMRLVAPFLEGNHA